MEQVEARISGNLVLEEVSHHFCCFLFVRNEIISPARVGGTAQIHEKQEAKITRGHCGGRLSQ